MRELTLLEMNMVSGAGNAVDTVNATVTTGGAGAAVGVAISTARGAAGGARGGLVGAVVGGAIGLAAGVYDCSQDDQNNQDGSDYGGGANY